MEAAGGHADIRSSRHGAIAPRAFTLVELLVSIAIIAILVAMLLPAAAKAISAARAFKCQASQRTSAFDFAIFADDVMHGSRGHDNDKRGFRLETFQESQYCIDEFWCWPDRNTVSMPDAHGNDPMRCTEVSGPIVLRRNAPCTGGGVSPPQNISFSFNLWLNRPEVFENGRYSRRQVMLTSTWVIDNPMVPLFWDVDGEAAFRRGRNPVFTGPALDSVAYANDAYWFPALRHAGRANFAFLDGHVDASRDPLNEGDWAWNATWPR